MKPPLFIRPLTQGEQPQLEDALHTADAFRLRRAQYLLASARGLKPYEIAQTYGGCEQNVRNVIRAFNRVGCDCLTRQSQRPKTTRPVLEEAELARLQHLLHQSPRVFGKKQSTWTQGLLAEVACEQGLTEQTVSDETIRRALKRLGANWKRAKHWISSPDPQYALKKTGETACFASPMPIPNGC
jgi:transposase